MPEPYSLPMPAVLAPPPPVGDQTDLLGGPSISDADLAYKQYIDDELARLRAEGQTDEEIREAAAEEIGDIGPFEDQIEDGTVPPSVTDRLALLRAMLAQLEPEPPLPTRRRLASMMTW